MFTPCNAVKTLPSPDNKPSSEFVHKKTNKSYINCNLIVNNLLRSLTFREISCIIIIETNANEITKAIIDYISAAEAILRRSQ